MPNAFFDIITEGVSVPLTQLASGYKPVGLIGTNVFPIVKSVTKGGKIPIFGKDAFKIYSTLRARGAKSNRAQIDPDSWLTFFCEEHDLCYPLDNRELQELRNLPTDSRGKALFNLQDRQRRRVQWNLALEKEKAIADYVQDYASYAAGNKVTLLGNARWNVVHTDSVPSTNIETGREAIRSAIGIYPNSILMGANVWAALKFHADYTAKMRYTNDKMVTPEFVKQMHQLDNFYIGSSMQLNSSGAFVDLWANYAVLYYAPATTTPELDEPSFGFTITPGFSEKPYPYVDIFTEEGGKIVNVRCTDMWDVLCIMRTAGYIIKAF